MRNKKDASFLFLDFIILLLSDRPQVEQKGAKIYNNKK